MYVSKMAASMEEGFDPWLSRKLLAINPDVDLEIFVEYIRSMLEDDMDKEERTESIVGILSQITEDGLEEHCADIEKCWVKLEEQKEADNAQAQKDKPSIDEKMHSILEQNKKLTVDTMAAANPKKKISSVDEAQKRAILAQYSQVSDGEKSDDGEEASGNADDVNFVKNFNAQMVVNKQQQEREKSKAESEKKRQKDKEDREKQKAKVQERKENERKRTQKGEKRR